MCGRNGAATATTAPMPSPTTIDSRTTRCPITAAAGRSSRPSCSATIVCAGIASASSDSARNMNMLITIWCAASVGSSMRPAIAVAPPNTASIEPPAAAGACRPSSAGAIPATRRTPLRRGPQPGPQDHDERERCDGSARSPSTTPSRRRRGRARRRTGARAAGSRRSRRTAPSAA